MEHTEFISHLEEFRKRALISFAAFVLLSIGCYFFSKDLLDFLIQPLQKYQVATLFFQKPHEAFLIHLKVAGLTGFVFSSPVIFSQGWLFVSPGLYPSEKKFLLPLTVISILLFLIGAAFAYYVVVPVGLHFLLSFQTEGLQPLIGISPYFSFLTGMVLAFGILFDFPVILLGLVRLGVVTRETFLRLRKPMIVIIFILAAILTPSPDPVSQLMLAGPLLVLFEISLFLAKFIEKTPLQRD